MGIVIDVTKGIGLVIFIWILFIFIAFVVFSPTTEDTVPILITWISLSIVFVLVLLSFTKFFNARVTISIIVFLMILIGLYFIPINNNIPIEVIELNEQLNQNPDKYLYAKDLFFEIERKNWRQPTREYLKQPHKTFFIKSFNYFWNLEENSYVPSHIQAQIFRKLLLESNRFDKNEVFNRQSVCSNSPHGYVEIIKEDRVIWVDFWAAEHFEDYKFGMRTKPPCEELIGEEF